MSRAKQFRSRTEELTLPSGLTRVYRKVNGILLVSKGGCLPDTMTAMSDLCHTGPRAAKTDPSLAAVLPSVTPSTVKTKPK